MEIKQKQLDKERAKALGDILVQECKSAHYQLESVAAMLGNGADVCYNNCRPLYFAAKNNRFDLVTFLVENGALKNPIAFSYIASMCDNKGFSDECEPEFFELLDLVLNYTDDRVALFTPYINNMAVNGRLDKILAFCARYGMSEREAAKTVYIRIIFEIIMNNDFKMLEFIERYNKWIDQSALDLSVSAGEWIILEHILLNSEFRTPSTGAVAQAVYEGYIEILEMLASVGYDFSKKPLLLEKACRAAYTKGTKSLEFLLKHGYRLTDKYKGKTIFEHAIKDKNAPLQEWLDKKSG